jgi:hypothetical protein
MNKPIFNKPIYLMPFTATSILMFNYLRNNNVNVLGFCDNNTKLHLKQFFGSTIYLPSVAFSKNPDASVILWAIRFFDEMEEQLIKIGFNDIIKFMNLSFDFDLMPYINILDDDAYYKLAPPKQVDWGKKIVKIAPVLKTWTSLAKNLSDGWVKPYEFKENTCLKNYKINNIVKFIVLVNATQINTDCFGECIISLSSQTYDNFSILVICTSDTDIYVREILKKSQIDNVVFLLASKCMDNIDALEFARSNFDDYNKFDYIITLGADDKLAQNALITFAAKIEENERYKIFTANEDRIYNNEHIAPYHKIEYQESNLINTAGLLRNVICVDTKINRNIRDFNINEIYIIEDILYHYRIYTDTKKNISTKAIAYYLPQFHTIPENDEWWGKGFTEWTNTRKAYPMFDGHYQPRESGELGYYDLVNDKDIQKRQIELARKHNIYGFCYYYYWFNGKRLLEKPLNNILNHPELDFPFCICWANENWTRRWDGLENEMLMEQKHNEESDERFINDVLPILKDSRYIKINGAPLLLIYKYDLFPNFEKTVKIWRKIAKENGLDNIHISAVETTVLPGTEFGCDSVVEFPPWKNISPSFKDKLHLFNENFSGQIYDYEDYVYRNMNKKRSLHLCFRGLMLGFDNTARLMNNATIFYDSTPEKYKTLLMSLVDFTSRNIEEERLIFINAWNEWAEGNYLEPDVKYDDAYLKATFEALNINCQMYRR